MSTFEAIILGIIQGITEFLPVSSSGHLSLGQHLFGFENLDNYIAFDLTCHLGTLLAIFLVYSEEIRNLFKNNRSRLLQILVGTLPLFPTLLILKSIESMYDKVQFIGFFFLLTALLLYLGIRWGRNKPQAELDKSKWKDALTIGTFQVMALLPGVSRSGSTISGARLLGWSKDSAVTFSFLLAIPAILGGATLKTLQLLLNGNLSNGMLGTTQYFWGFTTSFCVGYGSLLLLIKLAAKDKLMYFVWYCLLLGIGTTLYFMIF